MDISEVIIFLEELLTRVGYPGIFLIAFIEESPLGWVLPGGLFLSLAGFFAEEGNFDLLTLAFFAWLGAWSTMLFAYLFGKVNGYFLIKLLRQDLVAKKVEKILKKENLAILLTASFNGTLRFWIAYLSGVSRYKFFNFALISAPSALTGTFTMILIGYLTGGERANIEELLKRFGVVSWILVASFVVYVISRQRKEFRSFKGKYE